MRGLRAAMMAAVLAAAGGMWAGKADAAATFTFVEQGGNVVGTLSGSLDLPATSPIGGLTSGALIFPSLAVIVSAEAAGTATNGYDVLGPDAFGPGVTNTIADSRSGLVLHLFGGLVGGGLLWVEATYVSGDAMTGSMTFTGTDFATMGVTPGSYVYTLATQDTLTVVFRAATEVPAPASLPLLAGALGMLGLAGTVRRREG
ncbi:hypothetical protein [Roseomonas sp. AR75]|uniref:hypothetical protein n=1 Tax=Roseomonas sp. AR75 TaxID=2562311 RepID=UPI0010C0261D|nr:hypothetical protein [Roseomonas sp. AR75]